MDKEDLVYLFFALLQVGAAGAYAIHLHRRVKARLLMEAKAKSIYSWLCLGFGILSCVALLVAIVELGLPLGHGAVFATVPMFSLPLTVALIVAGRVIVGWEAMRW